MFIKLICFIFIGSKANVTLFNIQTVYKELGGINCGGLPETSVNEHHFVQLILLLL